MDRFHKDVLPYKDKKRILTYNLDSKEINTVKEIINEKFSITETNVFTDILAVPSIGAFIDSSGISESELTCLFEYYFEGHSIDKSWVMVFMKSVKIPITLKGSPIYVYKENNIKEIYEQLCHVANMY